jgi:amidase
LTAVADQHRVHAFTDDALGTYDAVGLVAAMHAGDVSVPEVVDAAIARAEKLDPELNGIAYPAFDRAREAARDPRPGYFAGVPTWLKDNVQVAGMPTMDGADAWVPRTSRTDGDFARMFLATGLLPLGKTQLSEYGFSPSAEHPRLGPVRNPWDPSRSAGASSAGSAAMVAAGVVPLAHANDGGGSIRIPAAVNGLVGLKPTRDRLAQDKVMRDMPIRIVSDGVVSRSVRDTAAFFHEAEKVYRALHLPPIGDITRPARARLRVGVATTVLGRTATPEVTELTLKTASLLESLGHRVEEATVPVAPTLPDDFLLYWSSLALYLVRSGRRAHGRSWDPTRLDNLTHGLARHARRHLPRLPVAIARLRRSRRASARFFATYDVLLTPTLAGETPSIGHLDPRQDYDTVMGRIQDWLSVTPWQNATGDPAISLPLATTASGLPQGMMFGAGAGREALLLELAYELEEAHPFARIDD